MLTESFVCSFALEFSYFSSIVFFKLLAYQIFAFLFRSPRDAVNRQKTFIWKHETKRLLATLFVFFNFKNTEILRNEATEIFISPSVEKYLQLAHTNL